MSKELGRLAHYRKIWAVGAASEIHTALQNYVASFLYLASNTHSLHVINLAAERAVVDSVIDFGRLDVPAGLLLKLQRNTQSDMYR